MEPNVSLCLSCEGFWGTFRAGLLTYDSRFRPSRLLGQWHVWKGISPFTVAGPRRIFTDFPILRNQDVCTTVAAQVCIRHPKQF